MKLIPFRAAHVDLFTPRWPGTIEGAGNPDSLAAGETMGPAKRIFLRDTGNREWLAGETGQ